MLTIIAKLALIHRVLAEGEFLQIGVGFRQKTNDKHATAGRVQCGHCLWCFGLRVPRRVNDDDWQRYDKDPNSLQKVFCCEFGLG